MVKTSKRAKKFDKKGGITAALKKGTVAKKGKFVMKRKKGTMHGDKDKNQKRDAGNDKSGINRGATANDDDFIDAPSNMANLDIESFFRDAAAVADAAPKDDKREIDAERDEDDNEADSESQGEDAQDDDADDAEDDASDASSVMDIEEEERLMKEEMGKLSEQDPDFHSFLSQNERSLLEFGHEEEDEAELDAEHEVDDADGAEDDMDVEETNKSTAKEHYKSGTDEDAETKKIMTPTFLKKLERQAFGKEGYSLRALKSLLSAYRTAAHYADADENDVGAFTITSSVVFDRLMITCLRNCQVTFRHQFLLHCNDETMDDEDSKKEEMDPDKPIHPKTLAKAPKKVAALYKSFMISTLHLLEEGKDPELLTFVLRSLSSYLPLLTPYPKIARNLLKILKDLWSSPVDDTTHTAYQSVRLHAFLRVRQLALTQPFPFVDECLKCMYLAFAKNAKFMNETTLPTLHFWNNCIVELYSLDLDSSYQHAFVYIRQLALHLRTALQKKTKEALRTVYCAQYLNCCRLWVDILCAHPANKEGLYSLVYPMTEIIMGVIRLLPTPRYLPLRLHCVRMLQQLAASTETFIPTTSILLDALNLKELHARPQKMGKKGLKKLHKVVTRLELVLKLPEDGLKNAEQLDICVTRIFVDLNREMDLYRYSPAFPEFSVRVCQVLRKFAKETRNSKWRAFAKGCIETCDKQSAYAIDERSKLLQAPKDVKRIEALKPQDAPNMKARFDSSMEKEKKLDVALQPVKSKASLKREQTETEKALHAIEVRRQKKKSLTVGRDASSALNDLNEDEVEEGVNWSDDESEAE
jgi:nucleolar complex protein 2